MIQKFRIKVNICQQPETICFLAYEWKISQLPYEWDFRTWRDVTMLSEAKECPSAPGNNISPFSSAQQAVYYLGYKAYLLFFVMKPQSVESFHIPWDERNFTNYSINLQFSIFQCNFCYFLLTSVSLLRIPQIQPTHAIHTGKQGWVSGWPHNIINIVWIIFKWVQRLVILKRKSWFSTVKIWHTFNKYDNILWYLTQL